MTSTPAEAMEAGDLALGVSWVYCSDGGVGSLNAVGGGLDQDTSPLYVGRFKVDNNLIPGKIVPSENCAYVPYDSKEKKSKSYEALQCTGTVKWLYGTNGNVPNGALVTGNTAKGEPLYSCRVAYKGTFTIGKVDPLHKTAYISYDGGEIAFSQYEVLVVSPQLQCQQ